VDGDGVDVGEFVEFGEVVVQLLVSVSEHGEGLFVQGQGGDDPDGAVEDPCLAFVLIVAQLGDLVPGPEHPPAVPLLRRLVTLGGQSFLQQGVEVAAPTRCQQGRSST
jgi:hypothetical protein